jgi:hypothetical protein
MKGRLADRMEVPDEVIDRCRERIVGPGPARNERKHRLPRELRTRPRSRRVRVRECAYRGRDIEGQRVDPAIVGRHLIEH